MSADKNRGLLLDSFQFRYVFVPMINIVQGCLHESRQGSISMPIILRLDRIMADRKISLNDLAKKVEITNVNLSRIKTGKIRAVRFSTLEALCSVLECQPGDLLEYVSEEETIDVDEDFDY